MNNSNDRRILEGEAAVLASSDARANDPLTAASDTLANVLHFVTALGGDPEQLIERALRTYQGDQEDEAATVRLATVPPETVFEPRPEALEYLAEQL